MKLIVVEDEPNALMGMRKTIESIDMEFTLFTSNQAEQALEIIQEHRPDLIVTDIMLPGMTGLDMVERFTDEYYQPKVIVVSGYNDFEYARRSIRLGAVDYLLKPFSTEEFADKIRRSLSLIQVEKVNDYQLKQQKSYAEIGNRSMRDNYLIDFCLRPTPLEEHLYERLRLWEIEWLANQSYSLIVIDTSGYPDGKPLGREFSLQTFAIGNIMKELIREFSPTIFLQDTKNRWVLMTGTEHIQALVQIIVDRVKQFQKITLSIGVSSRKSLFENIYTAYNEALKAFRIHSLSIESDYYFSSKQSESIEVSSPEEMATMIYHKEEDLIKHAAIQFIHQTILLEGTDKREDIIRLILNYISQIHIALSEENSRELEEIPMSVWETFDECKTIEEYEAVLIGYLMKLSNQLHVSPMNAIVERAKDIITSRYMENLTLNIIAEELSIHPVWLSQLFKKETGQTYMNYMTETRIGRAKVLLRETGLKIYEIAENVGYGDLQYFGNLFKKRTGQTPKEYRYGK